MSHKLFANHPAAEWGFVSNSNSGEISRIPHSTKVSKKIIIYACLQKKEKGKKTR
jgi:hypothetical protein